MLWNNVLVCVTSILGLVLCYCMVYIIMVFYIPIFIPRVMIGTHLVDMDLVCMVDVLDLWRSKFSGIVWKISSTTKSKD